MGKISFTNADHTLVFRTKRKVASFINQLFELEGKACSSLTYIFCTDEYLLNVNKRFLQHDVYTDIITFDLSTTEISGVLGEIYISVDRVKENAAKYRCSVEIELLRVIFHGALHLCGYNDKKKSEITIMRQKEDEYLLLFEKLVVNDH